MAEYVEKLSELAAEQAEIQSRALELSTRLNKIELEKVVILGN